MLDISKRANHLHSLPTSITIGNAQIHFKQSVKNLGLTLDSHLSTNAYVSKIARTCYFELRRLSSIRRFPTSSATATLVSTFVLSRIDYCNSLQFGSTHDVKCHLTTAVLRHNMSLTCCGKSHHTSATLAPAHTPCLSSIDLHTVRQHLLIARFHLLLILSGTQFQMMSGVPHHCHHLSLV